jgi:hypothetical protein
MVRPSRNLDLLFRKPAVPDLSEDLKRQADRICFLIVASDYPDVDIDIEIRNLGRWCEMHLPQRRDLFEIIYVNRFQRLREQFRS